MQNSVVDKGKLHVVKSLMLIEPINFKSANELIDVTIANGSGPELIFDDGSRIIFSSYAQYYRFIANKGHKIYDADTQEFDIENMNELYFKCSDQVASVAYDRQIIYQVDLYIDESDNPIYRFYTMEG